MGIKRLESNLIRVIRIRKKYLIMENKSVLEGCSEEFKYLKLKERIRQSIASSAFAYNHFKIGKTGQTLDDRYNNSSYKVDYNGISPLHVSENPDEISQLEADLIENFIGDPKCDNDRTTDKDDMTSSERYTLYLVWN